MGNFEDRYTKLNSAQKEAVDCIDGPVLVVAGPGSGKTELLALRVANILRLTDAPASSLLCLTFTESASSNMRQRLIDLIGSEGYRVPIHTFHSFGSEIIGRFPEYFYKGATFRPADDLIKRSVIEEVVLRLHYTDEFRNIHSEFGLIYINDIASAISNLKKSGLSPDEFLEVVQENEKFILSISNQFNDLFSQRVSKNILQPMFNFVQNFPRLGDGLRPIPFLQNVFLDGWQTAIEESLKMGSTSFLTQWKESNTRKVDGKIISTQEYYLPKMKSLALVYKQYQEEIYKRGYYDFEDMLLRVIDQLENNETLRAELQEKYLYISVDEFQDTNDAQMRILYNLTNSPVLEEKPNIMVVGDDDQAIYKFQGAEIGNIFKFKNRFKESRVITLTDNYRSGQVILDLARKVVLQGQNRLENMFPKEIHKKLVAVGKNAKRGSVIIRDFSTPFYESAWMVQEIKRLIDEGVPAERIAVLGRHHKNLLPLIPLFNALSIPVQYQKESNVLYSPPVAQLIQILRFLSTVNRIGVNVDCSLLPEILSYPFWKIDSMSIWKLSQESYREKKSWVDCIFEGTDTRLQEVLGLLINLGQQSVFATFDSLLISILDDLGFKDYYFGGIAKSEGDGQYIEYLADLNTFLSSLTAHYDGGQIKIEQVVEFVDLHLKNKIEIIRKNDFIQKGLGVNLMTAHKAKGLEFEVVFVINCVDDVWKSKGRTGLIKFPQNLSISPDLEDTDDQMRLFFVALTRAERLLYLTSYQKKENGDSVMKISYLNNEDGEGGKKDNEVVQFESQTNLFEFAQASVFGKKDFLEKEREWLQQMVANYKISASDLRLYLDVSRGGPVALLEKRILKFPESKNVHAIFGSIMHLILEELYVELKRQQSVPPKDWTLARYAELLNREHLSSADMMEYMERGKDAIEAYYLDKVNKMNCSDLISVSFYNQGVVVNGAHLTGEIDKIVKSDKNSLIICDYKTGEAISKWSDPKGFATKNQLLFYKLLLNHSRDYSKYEVESAYLDFLEPKKSGTASTFLHLAFDPKEEVELIELIGVVYNKIINLDFPDVSGYKPSIQGMQMFKQDLLSGKI